MGLEAVQNLVQSHIVPGDIIIGERGLTHLQLYGVLYTEVSLSLLKRRSLYIIQCVYMYTCFNPTFCKREQFQ